ncbi:Reverse transcriptase domain-containing protein [Aphis craccivora]|uniref:Reverse transcriptase domain-containing protein n=1 Tax=Aphis craccivora TaxID=307492 RepID=A0A6G0YP97_APHCR|nr:Reverse transcriptase domain-containing protein [Aphis craccivora]
MEEQHGFCPNRSIITNSPIFHNFVYNAFQNHSQIYALNIVNHAVLMNILKAFTLKTDTNGLNCPMLNLMSFQSAMKYRKAPFIISYHHQQP